MPDDASLTPAGRALAATACVAAGVLPILGALDMGPLHQRDIHGPPWIGGAAGAAFVFAGVGLAAGFWPRLSWIGSAAGFLAALSLAAVGNWVAFGLGARACTGGISGVFSGGATSGIECRIAFGLGAAMLDGALLWVFATALARRVGPRPVLTALASTGKWLLLAALSPLLLLLVVAMAAKALPGVVRERIATGRWPRNEAFIARIKARRGQSGPRS